MTNKNKTITDIVLHLQAKFGDSEILIKDFWDADNCATSRFVNTPVMTVQ